jgi:iron-sulfur cluster repair protein YtfE (RIC family)
MSPEVDERLVADVLRDVRSSHTDELAAARRLQMLLTRVIEDSGSSRPELKRVASLVSNLQTELAAHAHVTERLIFPAMLREDPGTIRAALRDELEREDRLEGQVRRIAEARGSQLERDSDPVCVDLLQELSELQASVCDHLRIEREVLLSRCGAQAGDASAVGAVPEPGQPTHSRN